MGGNHQTEALIFYYSVTHFIQKSDTLSGFFYGQKLMNYLLLSICFSVAVSVVIKIWRARGISIEQAIFMNYPTAALLTFFISKPNLQAADNYLSHWWLFAALGILLPSIFIVLGKSIEKNGIVRTDAAQRLSLIISIIAAFWLFKDQLSYAKAIGIALTFIALILLLKSDNQSRQHDWLWLIAVWGGYGVIDILLKRISLVAEKSTLSTLFITFILAALLMLAYLLIMRRCFDWRSLACGIVLGMLNFGNIFTYIRAHQVLKSQTALVFTIMNIGVILLATLLGLLFFKETLSRRNTAGIIIAVIAVYVLYNGSYLLGGK